VPNILLLVSPSCGACPSAKSLWKQLRVKYSFSYREVDITTEDGRSLADRHSVRAVPATIIDGRLTFVGTPSQVAEQMNNFVQTDGSDGFVLAPHLTPTGLDGFVDTVVPLLQERGVLRTEYETTTLRGHLGLPAAGVIDAGARVATA